MHSSPSHFRCSHNRRANLWLGGAYIWGKCVIIMPVDCMYSLPSKSICAKKSLSMQLNAMMAVLKSNVLKLCVCVCLLSLFYAHSLPLSFLLCTVIDGRRDTLVYIGKSICVCFVFWLMYLLIFVSCSATTTTIRWCWIVQRPWMHLIKPCGEKVRASLQFNYSSLSPSSLGLISVVWLVVACLILSYLILSYLILSYLILSY